MDKSIYLDSRIHVDWTIDGVEGGYMDLVSTEYAWALLEGLKRGQSDWSAIKLDQIDLTPLAILAFDVSRQATDGRIPGRMTTVQYGSTPDSLASGTELAVGVCDYLSWAYSSADGAPASRTGLRMSTGEAQGDRTWHRECLSAALTGTT
nr:hypothetical protein CFP56_72622 [Quercus suber]